MVYHVADFPWLLYVVFSFDFSFLNMFPLCVIENSWCCERDWFTHNIQFVEQSKCVHRQKRKVQNWHPLVEMEKNPSRKDTAEKVLSWNYFRCLQWIAIGSPEALLDFKVLSTHPRYGSCDMFTFYVESCSNCFISHFDHLSNLSSHNTNACNAMQPFF